MRVRTALADPAPLAGIERLVRRDVPGLHSLQPINEPPRHTPSPIPALDDPGKRVASIVAGAEPYVVTVDGTRYFVGAMLPTGHRIELIDGSRVELEREGERSAIVF
jgi:type III secretion protein D